MKKILLVSMMYLWVCSGLQAQQINNAAKKYIATTEKEMYELLKQMMDSTVSVKETVMKKGILNNIVLGEDFAAYFHSLERIENSDTVMMFVQNCDRENPNKCNNSYFGYISDCMPVVFYERFLDYLKELRTSESYYKKIYSFDPLYSIRDILRKQYESNKLNKEDNNKALELIEKISLRNINEECSYTFINWDFDQYMTDSIRKALINRLENPYYPSDLWDSYKVLFDTTCVDITSIPDSTMIKYESSKSHSAVTDEERTLYDRKYYLFKRYDYLGKYKYNGLSAGQVYLKEREKEFVYKGYSHIEDIEKYAYNKRDQLLIKHLKEFKKKHPDFPLKYF